MKTYPVHINFPVMKKALREYVRKKAIAAGSTIIYMEKGKLIEENPKTSQKIKLTPGTFRIHA